MNLLTLMIKENVEWPSGARFAAQDDNSEIHFYKDEPYFDTTGNWASDERWCYVSCIYLSNLTTDWNTKVITKEEWEAMKELTSWSNAPSWANLLVDTGEFGMAWMDHNREGESVKVKFLYEMHTTTSAKHQRWYLYPVVSSRPVEHITQQECVDDGTGGWDYVDSLSLAYSKSKEYSSLDIEIANTLETLSILELNFITDVTLDHLQELYKMKRQIIQNQMGTHNDCN